MTGKHNYLFYFHLVPPDDISNLLSAAGSGQIHDFPTVAIPADLFFYILDTLKWIPTRFGELAKFPFERSVIASEGAAKARVVFGAWKQLFSAADLELLLRCPDGRKLTFCRDEIVAAMASLERFTETVENGGQIIYCSDSPDYRKQMVGGTRRKVPALAGK